MWYAITETYGYYTKRTVIIGWFWVPKGIKVINKLVTA